MLFCVFHYLLYKPVFRLQSYTTSPSGVIQAVSPANPSATPFTGCFGGGPGRLGDTAGTLTINTARMIPGLTYVFYVIVTKDTRQADAEVTVVLGAVAAPVVNVT